MSCDTRWRTSAALASCARCWHKVSIWIPRTSKFCTGPDCTDYPLADFLPFIESPLFKTRSLWLRVFFIRRLAERRLRRFPRAPLEWDAHPGYAPRATRPGQKAWFLPAKSGPVVGQGIIDGASFLRRWRLRVPRRITRPSEAHASLYASARLQRRRDPYALRSARVTIVSVMLRAFPSTTSGVGVARIIASNSSAGTGGLQ